MSRAPWTDEEYATLAMMIADGCGGDEIGAALGRSRLAIFCAARRRGLAFDVNAAKVRRTSAMIAARREGRYNLTPEGAAARAAAAGRGMRARWADPETRALMTAKIQCYARSEEGRRIRSEAARVVGRGNGRAKELPEPFHDEYRGLMRKYGYTSARALDKLKPRVDAWLQSFEGQLWRIANGRARLVANVKISRAATTLATQSVLA